MARGSKVKPSSPPPPGGSGAAAPPDIGFQGLAGAAGQALIGGMAPAFSGDITYGDPSTWQFTRYYEGDENAPYNYNPDESWALQLALVRAGYMSKSALANAWTGSHSTAYKRALEDANRYGVSVEQLLAYLADENGPAGSGSGSGSGLGVAGITDEDIIALANKTAQGVLGRDLRQDEIGNFVPAFRGVLGSGTSPQVSAENMIRQQTAPGEAGAHDVGSAMQALTKMLGG